MTSTTALVLAAHRAGKTFAQAFVGSIVATWIGAGDASITGLLHTVRSGSDMAGGTALLAALAAMGWNTWRPSGGDPIAIGVARAEAEDRKVWPR
jgi:hypothetical protein